MYPGFLTIQPSGTHNRYNYSISYQHSDEYVRTEIIQESASNCATLLDYVIVEHTPKEVKLRVTARPSTEINHKRKVVKNLSR